MKKPIIAIDVDDTLAQHLDLRKLGLNTDAADVYKMDWSKMLADPAQISQLLTKATEVFRDLSPMEGASEVLQELHSEYDFIVMTARPERLRDVTENWIDANFPNIFAKKFFSDSSKWSGGNEMKTGLARVKAEICQREGAAYLIDDQLVNCEAVAKVGVRPVLFGGFVSEIPDGLLHVRSWAGVAEILERE